MELHNQATDHSKIVAVIVQSVLNVRGRDVRWQCLLNDPKRRFDLIGRCHGIGPRLFGPTK
jgi:hypothetical protein